MGRAEKVHRLPPRSLHHGPLLPRHLENDFQLDRGAERKACGRWAAESLRRLPFANVCTAVYVQHLPGDVTGFRQINDTVSDVLRVGDRTHR
jgi:hypothetical protein